jgi:putative membrane protein
MKKCLALLIVGLPVVAFAASNPDESFFKDAAQAGMAEVAAGRTAQEKGTNQAVEDFGAMMVKDHSAANANLKKIAVTKGVKLPASPSISRRRLTSGKDLDGKAFATESFPRLKLGST